MVFLSTFWIEKNNKKLTELGQFPWEAVVTF